jgi:iron complex outermembrane receptor protein
MLLAAAAAWADDPQQDLSSLTLEQLMNVKVEAAALHLQTLRDAPASVTVITAEDIYTYGYRTLGEALASARGFSMNDNRTYRTVGVRGFNLPWDYGSRILVMVDGHNMADHIFDSMLWFGDDFPIDMHLVKRIEIIRGPSSALYGSSGVFATINVVTKPPEEAGAPSLTTQFGSFGEQKAQMMAALPAGKQVKVLLSGTVFHESGESPLNYSGFGAAVDMDSARGYHFFSNVTWGGWNLTAVLSDRYKIQPISWGDSVFNDRGTHVDETASYVEAVYTHDFARGTLRWRASYNQDHLRGRFDYPLHSATGDAIEDNRTFSYSDWIETQLTYRFDVAHLGTLTAGAEAQIDLRAYQGSKDVSPVPVVFANINIRDTMYALFLQNERKLSGRWTLDLGLRLDGSAYRRSFVSPRAALLYQPSSAWTYKFLYGRAFRNPSAFDLFFGDGLSAVANPNARPEKADTIEVDVERRMGKRLHLVTAAYGYRIKDFLVGVYTPGGLSQTQNSGGIHARGIEFELQTRPLPRFEATASYALQEADYSGTDAVLSNSPQHLAKLRFAVPMGRKFDLSSGMQYYSARGTLGGAFVKPVYLSDFTITSRRLFPNFDVRAGVRNALNRNYSDPIALNPRVDSMQQPGRTLFVELILRGSQ